jgi:hypothetical protein
MDNNNSRNSRRTFMKTIILGSTGVIVSFSTYERFGPLKHYAHPAGRSRSDSFPRDSTSIISITLES